MILYFLLKNEHTDFNLLNMQVSGSDNEIKSIKNLGKNLPVGKN